MSEHSIPTLRPEACEHSSGLTDAEIAAAWRESIGGTFVSEELQVFARHVFELGWSARWQPIETAPRDGTAIILSNGRSVSWGWWCHEEPYIRENRDLEGRYINQDEFDGFDGWMDVDGGMLPEPTHWMPQPNPPREWGACNSSEGKAA